MVRLSTRASACKDLMAGMILLALSGTELRAQALGYAPLPREGGTAWQDGSERAASPGRAVPGGDAESRSAGRLKRAIVDYPTREPVGTVIVDTGKTYLYYVLGQNRAVRYGVGVGREGFTWSGVQAVSRKSEWPDWVPPAEMIARQPYLPRFMAGGPGNPLGARALYLGGSLYRIHGTNDPATIGSFVSSGCIRLSNEDVIDLFNRVSIGTKVVVLPKSSTRERTREAAPTVRPTAQRQAMNLSAPPSDR